MSSTGRGCNPQPPLPGIAAPSALPAPVHVASQHIDGDHTPAMMLFPDWRALAGLTNSTTPSSVELSQQQLTDEDRAARLLLPEVLYVLPQVSSTPPPVKPVVGNATWG
jgi:hypothetical protein